MSLKHTHSLRDRRYTEASEAFEAQRGDSEADGGISGSRRGLGI